MALRYEFNETEANTDRFVHYKNHVWLPSNKARDGKQKDFIFQINKNL